MSPLKRMGRGWWPSPRSPFFGDREDLLFGVTIPKAATSSNLNKSIYLAGKIVSSVQFGRSDTLGTVRVGKVPVSVCVPGTGMPANYYTPE